jgi:hypothetical protein
VVVLWEISSTRGFPAKTRGFAFWTTKCILIRPLRQDDHEERAYKPLIFLYILPVTERYNFLLNQCLVILHLIPDASML